MTQALRHALVEACHAFGESEAIRDPSSPGRTASWRYVDLLASARSLAGALDAAGITASEPVHVLVSNRAVDFVALLAIWLIGAVAVPVHRTTPSPVAARLQQRTGARFLVDGGAETRASRVIVLADVAPPPRALLDDAAFIIFTSGSTGEPKGVVVAQDAFHDKLQQIDSLLHFGAGEATLLVLNITFSFGLWLSLLTFLRGGTLVLQEKFDPSTFCDALVGQRIHRVGVVPTMMRVLFADPALSPALDRVVATGALRQILIGGESLGRSLADAIRARFACTDLVDIYGLSETATCDFFAFPADYARRPGTIGRPSPQVRYRIADVDGTDAPPDTIGELQIRSPYLMRGYLDAPDLTAAAYEGGWFRTGDLARVGDDGLVELMGRRKEVISRGGNKVTPVEIEQAVCAHPDIAAAMAVGIADPLLGERIHVLIVPRHGVDVPLASIRAFLEKRLERYKHPDRYYLATELPTGRTGKADRGQLRFLIDDGALAPLVA